MTVLVVAEHDNNNLHHTTLPVITAAQKLHPDVSVLVMGYSAQAVVNQTSRIKGIKQILQCDHEVYKDHLAENCAELIAKFAHEYTHVLAPATTFGKDLLPRVAGLLNASQISDITKIIDESTFVRPIYAGNAFETVQ